MGAFIDEWRLHKEIGGFMKKLEVAERNVLLYKEVDGCRKKCGVS